MRKKTFVITLSGPGEALALRFAQMLDVLPTASMEGGEEDEFVTLWYDVRARSEDEAIEEAYLRAHSVIRDFRSSGITFTATRRSHFPGRGRWRR